LFLERLNKESNEEIQNATRIREDEGQVPESRVQLESRKEEGGTDLERGPQVEPSGTTPPKEAEVAKPPRQQIPIIRINGKIYEGTSHADAYNKALAAGEKVSPSPEVIAKAEALGTKLPTANWEGGWMIGGHPRL
jgi:hypothetical protein